MLQTKLIEEDPETVADLAAKRLLSIVERIERLEEEKAALSGDIREVYAEAKSSGYDVKALREVVKLRKVEQHKLTEHESVVAVYRRAVGLDAQLPLFDDDAAGVGGPIAKLQDVLEQLMNTVQHGGSLEIGVGGSRPMMVRRDAEGVLTIIQGSA